MDIEKYEIEFKKDDNNNEFATVKVNDNIVINKKGKLDTNIQNIGAIYPRTDKDGIERSVLYRVSLLMSLIKTDMIEFEL